MGARGPYRRRAIESLVQHEGFISRKTRMYAALHGMTLLHAPHRGEGIGPIGHGIPSVRPEPGDTDFEKLSAEDIIREALTTGGVEGELL